MFKRLTRRGALIGAAACASVGPAFGQSTRRIPLSDLLEAPESTPQALARLAKPGEPAAIIIEAPAKGLHLPFEVEATALRRKLLLRGPSGERAKIRLEGKSPHILIGPEGALEIENAHILTPSLLAQIETVGHGRGAHAKMRGARLSFVNTRFECGVAPVMMVHNGYRHQAFAKLDRVEIRNCEIAGGKRGVILGDLGSFVLREVSVDGLSVSDVGRFGLIIGSTQDISARATEKITLRNIHIERLRYEAGKNCAHLNVVGRNVVIEDVSLTGADVEFGAEEESNKEALYLTCVDAKVARVTIADCLGDQAAIALKGRPLEDDHLKPKGGRYALEDVSVVQTAKAPGKINGLWAQVSDVSLKNMFFSGLSGVGVIANAPRLRNYQMSDIWLREHRGPAGIRVACQSGEGFLVQGLRMPRLSSAQDAPRRSVGVSFGVKGKNAGVIRGVVLRDLEIRRPGEDTAAIRFAPGPKGRFEDIRIEGCVLEAGAGLALLGGGYRNISIAACDLSAVADPRRAIMFARKRKGAPESVEFSLRIAPDVLGINSHMTGRAVFPPNASRFSIEHGLTPLVGFDPTPDLDEFGADTEFGPARAILADARLITLARPADAPMDIELPMQWRVSKTRWRAL